MLEVLHDLHKLVVDSPLIPKRVLDPLQEVLGVVNLGLPDHTHTHESGDGAMGKRAGGQMDRVLYSGLYRASIQDPETFVLVLSVLAMGKAAGQRYDDLDRDKHAQSRNNGNHSEIRPPALSQQGPALAKASLGHSPWLDRR